ncbi:P-loop containing nucleoside triphosphate hydrolase protein [Mycena metata]|uniref:P-loop containing nucleoside triphosphate hydrolase protein n=1 Tax=Mycena metata TaxID=1033252 RepID=A0AAD7DGT6_9AGAR|nr:P-loop containing nucleoside triphosphate hydrolase protein [Mycena metata]
MPRQDPATEARIHQLTACLTPAVTLLEDLNDVFGLPFIQPIVKTVQALIAGIQNVKRNKDECFELVEGIHQVLYPIIHLHLKAETAGSLLPSVLDKIAEFTVYVDPRLVIKIYTFIEIQQDGNKIRQFFRQSEANKLLKGCHTGLDQAIESFKVQTGFTMLNNVIQIQREAENMHKDLLELVETLSDGTISDRSSSVFYKKVNDSQLSSNSFSLLPSRPKIFYGRDSELKHIMEILSHDGPRIAILGGGGMGKTSLARAALHHTDTCAKFEHKFFVSAEAATTAVELVALIGLHLGLEPSKDLTKPIARYFAQQTGPCLLILDNLETPWEPITVTWPPLNSFVVVLTRQQITMRGSERPCQVLWTPPFLHPLQPLSDEASQQVFEEITDDPHVSKERAQLLAFTENMPLAVELMAHFVDHEGIDNVLTRWKAEKTAALSIGQHRTSNLDASISLSYSSPRITPGARELLRLLSILPDGLSDAELTQSNLPICNIQACRSVLIATSLAYKDTKSRLRSLVPIREHIQQFSPPSETLVQAIRKSLHHLLAWYQKHNGTHLGVILPRITANLANLEEVLQHGLHPGSPDLSETIQSE